MCIRDRLGKHAVDVLQPAAEQGGLGAGAVGVLAGFGTEVHHLALLHDQPALAVGHGDHRAIRDDVFAAVPVGKMCIRDSSYSCPTCGAELVCDETTAATTCPYCCLLYTSRCV